MADKRQHEDAENIPPRNSKKLKVNNNEPALVRRVLRSSRKASSGSLIQNCQVFQNKPASKRKFQTRGIDSVQQSKKRKLNDDFSCLPTECFNKVLQKLVPIDQTMKPLSEISRRFRNACESRINVLRLDFDRIADEGAYPNITRSCKVIKLFGREIQEDLLSIERVLDPSRFSARKLYIGSEDMNCSLSLEMLVFILNFLPEVDELGFLKVSIVESPNGNADNVYEELPRLVALKKLTLCNCTGDTLFSAFRRMNNLQELQIEGFYQENQAFNTLIASQRSLSSLLLNTNALQFENNSLPELVFFEISDKVFDFESRFPEQVFEIAPNIFQIKLLGQSASRHLFPADSFMMNSANLQLRSILIEMDSPVDFNITRIRENYPSLVLFKSANFEWSGTNVA